MPRCKDCGTWIGMANYSSRNKDICAVCAGEERSKASQSATTTGEAARNSHQVLVSTETLLEGVHVKKRLGVITAECAYGMNIFKDLFAGVRNIVGGRSDAVQKTMRDARETVLMELKREAHSVGANAVIAVDLDYTQIGDKGWNMVLLIASGTAVIIEEIPKTALDETEG